MAGFYAVRRGRRGATLRDGVERVRRVISVVALAVLGAGCQAAPAVRHASDIQNVGPLASHPAPYTEVAEGAVHALIPERWTEAPISEERSVREGLVASPNLKRWTRMDASVPGLEVAWVDVTRFEIPSDYYYLAANGPAVPRLTENCERSSHHVIVNHRPDFAGISGSPGDYAARAFGTCQVGDSLNRWAYFVAAPGYGPVRRVGIQRAGLYFVFAVLPDGPSAPRKLHELMLGARFGGDSVGELMLAASESARRLT